MHAPCSVFADKKPVSVGYFAKLLQTAVNQALLNHSITPHSFRIGAATHAAKNGSNQESNQNHGALTFRCKQGIY